MTENRRLARELANDAVKQGEPLSWFEQLYSQAAGNQSVIPWADMAVNPNLCAWLEKHQIETSNRRALVVGCGLGDDAEALAALGFQVTAFDISPTCIDWCRERFPNSAVEYLVADLFDLPAEWNQRFEFVCEAYTLQVLPADLRQQAMHFISDCVAAAGTLLVITRGRDEAEDPGKMPWPLVRTELAAFVECGLAEVQFEDYLEAEVPPVRRWRVEYRRQSIDAHKETLRK